MKTIKQTVEFNSNPEDVYNALMDSKKHSQFTGAHAKIDNKIGGKFEVYDGSINGTTIELIPGKKIVQKWYCETEGWPEGHYSTVTFSFKATKSGTKLEFVQIDVPDEAYEDISAGWEEYYWKPMKKIRE